MREVVRWRLDQPWWTAAIVALLCATALAVASYGSQDGPRKVLEGVTTPDEVMRVVFTGGH